MAGAVRESTRRVGGVATPSFRAGEMEKQVNLYTKTVFQAQKGMPGNPVVPRLKDSVDTFTPLLPCVVNLRNNNLQERHWDEIHALLGFVVKGDKHFTLGDLVNRGVTDHADAITAQLEHAKPAVRKAAIVALGGLVNAELPASSTYCSLAVGMLGDGEFKVRQAAIKLMGSFEQAAILAIESTIEAKLSSARYDEAQKAASSAAKPCARLACTAGLVVRRRRSAGRAPRRPCDRTRAFAATAPRAAPPPRR